VLDFTSLDALLRSLTLPSPRAGLQLSKEALDEKALRLMAQDEDVAAKVKNPVSLRILWEACQLPDFRKIGLDEHLKLVAHLFWSRLSPEGAVAEDWFEAQIQSLDKTEGDIDTLSSRLSGVRTLAYIAHRGGWLKRVDHWREVTRGLEERLSDKLHEALMQRFIDQRTSALLKALNTEDAPRPEVNAQGQVIMEGHVVGELKGLNFKLSSSETIIEDKTLRQAAHRAITPLLTDRLRDLGNTASKTLRVKNGQVLWHDAAVAAIEPGDYFTPQLKLLTEIDHPALVARATKRLTDYVRTLAQTQLRGLWKAKQAADAEGTLPQVRAIAYQLYENGGILRRDDSVKLSPEDKQALKALGVAGHRYAWFLPDILNPKTRHFMQGFGAAEGQRALSIKGQLGLGEHPPVSTRVLSQLDKIMGNGVYQKGVVYVRDADFKPLGLDEAARDKLLQALGFAKMPATTVRVPVKPAPVAPAKAEEVDVYAWVSPEPVIEAVAETAPAESFVEEERVGWRQRRPDSERPHRERPRHKKPHHGQRADKQEGERQGEHKPRHDRPKAEGAEGEKPRHKHGKGNKPHGKGDRNFKDENRAPKPKEPYINPYSPFAILREKLNTGR
jgi:ATP-dependent RNA helicase SUPV3L1/SUV3